MYINQHPSIIVSWIQDALYQGKPINSYQPAHQPEEQLKQNGIVYRNDIAYAHQYPNSYLDISYPDPHRFANRPTIIYFHGGGYFGGDKAMGDPLAENNNANALFNDLVQHGYNVVNVNYALVPEYRFPVPLIQMNQAINFLSAHSSEYDLNMNNVIIMGSSAGAILTSQYGALLSNSQYADSMNIHPQLTTQQVKALVIDDAPLQTATLNWGTGVLIRNYLGTNDLMNSKQAQQYNPLLHLTTRYPPSFLTAANTGGFPDDMSAFSAQLTSYGIDNEYFYLDPSHGNIPHGFLANIQTDAHAQACLVQLLEFIDKYTKLTSASL
ncbi:alpha/beta hydrolase [Paenibacillus sp. WLX1005]|uniref:alpha/beta hydrolase n=1 Tax=Paenibacillus sp. WLX1005 TaxID=3243766 RepID=UPI003983DAD4